MSSIYLYLSEEVNNKKGYKEEPQSKDGRNWTNCSIVGMHLYYDEGRPHVRLDHVESPIPETISDIVVGVSLHDWIPLRPKRISGIYKLESATATVDNSRDSTEVRITAEKIENLRELYYKIRAGQILPSENWEAEQITEPLIKKKIKDLLSRLRS